MKALRTSPGTRTVKAACTVSAAALMLGVSEAATIGFNFQTRYCAAGSYSGAPVTATAFGVSPENWESLTPMDTGYGCPASYFTLTESIDTTTSTDGLNPLPAGALSLTWSGYTANVSGFGGYDRSGPNYTYGGNGYHPGEEQVYWGFIRDGVNFGPGQHGGDNNQPGYSVDIVGLKSIFTNSPFVVQLIASSDSLQYLTNAFVVDANGSSTQSVVYASLPPIHNVGDTAWPRGVGGGFSTPTGPLDTDHVSIAGNQAEHQPPSGDPDDHGFNRASTIAGFIITDQPVVTMSPQPVKALPHDHVTLRAVAIGVPPLSIQWRKGGIPIPGATSLSLDFPDIGVAAAGSYDLVVTNAYGSAISKVSQLSVDHIVVDAQPFASDSRPSGTPHNGVVKGAHQVATSKDAGNVTRSGVLQFTAPTDQLILSTSGHTDFDGAQGTFSFWLRSAGVTDPEGHPAMILDHRAGHGLVIAQNVDGTLFFQTAPGSANSFSSVANVSDDRWHHIAVVYDQEDGGSIAVLIDGALDTQNANAAAWSWDAGQAVEVGHSHDAYWQSFVGALDDFRIYGRGLSDTEIASIQKSDAIVDPTTLEVQLNFDGALSSGVSVSWFSPTAVLQSADTVNGSYTDVPDATPPYAVLAAGNTKFYRYTDTHEPQVILSNPYDM